MKRYVTGLLASLFSSACSAQSAPNFSYGQVPTAAQWNSAFASKQDRLTFTPLNQAGGTMIGKLQSAAPTANGAGFRLLPGSSPVAPVEGDLWMSGGSLLAFIGGQTNSIYPLVNPAFSGTITAPKVTITGAGSAGDVSGMTATPNASAASGTLAKSLSNLNGFLSGGVGQLPVKKSSGVGDVVWVTNCLNLEQFGGLGDGATDNAPALTAAANQLLTAPSLGGCIYSPKGKHLFNSKVSFNYASPNQSVKIVGDGRNNTEWYWPTTDGLTVTLIDPTTTFSASDLAFTSGKTVTQTGVLLTIPGTSANAALGEYSDFSRVTFRGSDGYGQAFGWATGLIIDNVSNVNIDASSFIGTNASLGTGVTVAGHSTSSYAVVYNFSRSSWVHLNVGVQYGSYVQGMTLSQDNFTGVTNGVLVPANAAGILSQLTIVASQFAPNPNQPGAASVNVQTGVNPLIISNNLFLSNGPGTQIALGVHSFSTVSGNVLFSPAANNNAGITMGSGSSPVKINDNVIYGFAQAINLPNTTSNASITNNNLVGNTTAVANGGTSANGNRISGNSGFQPQPPAVQTLTGSPWTYNSPGLPTTICAYGGTISQVVIDGVLVATGSAGCFPIEPNENISIAYTAAPTVTVGVR